MSKFKEIFNNELKIVISDHSILLTVLIAPLLYAFFLGSIYLNKDIDNIRFAVVDYDKSPSSRKIYQYINSTQKVNVVGYLEDYDDAVRKLKDLQIEGFIIIYDGFEKKLFDGDQQAVNLYLNTTRFLPSNDLNKAVNDIFLEVAAESRMHFYEKAGVPHSEAVELMNPVTTTIYPIYNTTNSYGGFLLPGLFFLILQQTLLIGLGESVASDNQKGFLGMNIIQNLFSYLTGKTTYYYFLYISYLVFFMVVVFPFFNLNTPNEYLGIVTVFLLFITSVILLAFIFGSLIKSQIRVMEVLAFTSYPFFLLSGYSWPIDSMPLFLQWISYLIPTTPVMQAVTKLLVMNAGFFDVIHQIVHLLFLVMFYLLILLMISSRFKLPERRKVTG